MKEIPATKCLKYKIDDDISLSCVVVADIEGNDIENIIYGSKNGTIKVINMDGTLCRVQPLTSKGRLSAMCIRDKRIYACTVEGQVLVIVCNPIQFSKEYTHRLDVISSYPICFNCCIIRIFKAGRDYAVLGTAEGMVYLYEVLQNEFIPITNTFVEGPVVDITYKIASNQNFQLFVSCEGVSGYEMELHNNALKCTIKQASDCTNKDYLRHKTWVYPSQITCSCTSIVKAVTVFVKGQIFVITLLEDGSMYFEDQEGKQYRLDIRETIMDFNAYHIVDHDQQSRVVLVCRDLSFFHLYTDIWRFYQSLYLVC